MTTASRAPARRADSRQLSCQRDGRLAASSASRLIAAEREEARRRWDRDLPLGELFRATAGSGLAALGLRRGQPTSTSRPQHRRHGVRRSRHADRAARLADDGARRPHESGRAATSSRARKPHSHDTVRRGVERRHGRDRARAGEHRRELPPGRQAVIAKGVRSATIRRRRLRVLRQPRHPVRTWVAVGVPCRPIGRVEVDADGAIALVYERS